MKYELAICWLVPATAALFGWVGCFGACSEEPAVDSGLDGRIDAAALDGSPDAQDVQDAALADRTVQPDVLLPWDAGPPVDAVAGSVIQLPPSGQNITIGPWHHHNYVVYSEARSQNEDVFLFDLASQQEISLSSAVGDQSWSYIWESTVMWSDGRWYSWPDNPQYEIFQYDVQTQTITQVTNDGYYNALLRFNSSHILYKTSAGAPSGSNLILMDRTTSATRLLASYDTWWETPGLSESHASWVAHSPWEGGSSKSVYLHDIASGVTELLQGTVPGRQFQTSTWGDWVVWEDDRNGNWDIYAYQISTGQEHVLEDEPHDQVAPQVRDDLVVWVDYRWSGGVHVTNQLVDLVIYDLQNQRWRRLTGWIDYWGFGRAMNGWLLYRKHSGHAFLAQLFAMDLQANLILDASGRVMPPP